MESKNRTVIIVGGGLVGSLCAVFMAKRGYSVSVYEYREDPRTAKLNRGRSINLALSNRARRALRKVGIEEEILEYGIPMKGRYIHSLGGGNKSILYDARTNQCIYSVSRNFLNQKLLDEAKKHPNVKLFFNHKLQYANVEDGYLHFINTETNEEVEITGDFLIGADGAFSTLRRSMQLTSLFSYSQTFIDHGYIEMNIPPEQGVKMVPNHLHIWPRGEFMMIALPNLDGSWTVTLFMPFPMFEELNTGQSFLEFFKRTFPDSVELIGGKRLTEEFSKISPSALMSIKCSKFHYGRNILLVGDAAHAMVPFYGQGMNAGFEDCLLLNSILDSCDDNISFAVETFTQKRQDDVHAICDLALYNYVEMRHLVTTPSYRMRKVLDEFLFWLWPNVWIPLYNSVTFSKMTYRQCLVNRQWQDKCLLQFGITFLAIVIGTLFYRVYM